MKTQYLAHSVLCVFRTPPWSLAITLMFLSFGGSALAGQQATLPAESQPFAPAKIITEVDKSGGILHRRIKDYTYTLKKTLRLLNEQAKVEHEEVREFEAYPVRGEHVLIQVSQNGKPLLFLQIAEQRKRAGENLEKAEKEEQKTGPDGAAADSDGYMAAAVYGNFKKKLTYISIAPSTFLRSCLFSSPRTERIGEREVIVLNFQARPNLFLPAYQAYIARLRGTVWIDAQDKILTRLVGWSAARFPESTPAPSEADANVIYQQTRLPNGVWFPSLIRVNAASDPLVFGGVNIDVLFEFNDYKNFKIESEEFKPSEKDPKPDKPQKPGTDKS
jgi:hypothetical protein